MPSSLIEKAQKAAARTVKVAEEAKAKSLRERSAQLAERRLKQEMERQTAWIIGTTIRDLNKAGKLTPQQVSHVGVILALLPAKDRPKDWELVKDYLPPVRSVSKGDPVADAAE